MSAAAEIWRPVRGYEGLYEVSNLGRVQSLPALKARGGPRIGLRKIHTRSRDGYAEIALSSGGKRTTRTIHRLVLEAFTGPCPKGMQVRHLDGDKLNNVLSNLAYGTQSDNELDKVRHGTHSAHKTHCLRGHEFIPENTYRPPGRPASRHCRQCARDRQTA